MTVFNCSLRLTRKQILRPLHLDEVHSNRRSAHVFMLKLHVHVVDEDQVPSYSPHSIVNTHLCCRLLAYILFLCVLVSCHSILLINATITLWLVVFFNPLPKPWLPLFSSTSSSPLWPLASCLGAPTIERKVTWRGLYLFWVCCHVLPCFRSHGLGHSHLFVWLGWC